MRLIFLGIRSAFSHSVLEALLRAGFQPSTLIIPSAPPLPGEKLPALQLVEPPNLPLLPADTVSLAHAAGVPVWEAGRLRAPEMLAALRALAPDVMVTACFPRRLPSEWLAAPRLGSLNLHPSLLPAYRGPAPLFWQFRNDERRTGVTLHLMDENTDTGDIVAQSEVTFPDGIGYAEAEALTARAGAALLITALQRGAWPRVRQPETGVSLAPYPTRVDLIIPTDWPARRAYNFARGAEPFGPFHLLSPSGSFAVTTALDWATAPPPDAQAQTIWARFADGWVLFAQQP